VGGRGRSARHDPQQQQRSHFQPRKGESEMSGDCDRGRKKKEKLSASEKKKRSGRMRRQVDQTAGTTSEKNRKGGGATANVPWGNPGDGGTPIARKEKRKTKSRNKKGELTSKRKRSDG